MFKSSCPAKIRLILASLLLLNLHGISVSHAQTELEPVSIEYIVRLDHEKLGNATLGRTETILTKQDIGYAVHTKTKAQGLAAIIIGSNEQQSCQFSVEQGRAVSNSYSGGRTDSSDYQVEFDWEQRKIGFNSGDSLDMPQGYVVDSCNMPFAASLFYQQGSSDEIMYVVDGRKKRIRGYKLKSTSSESLETSIGTQETMKIVLEREFNPQRTFTIWLAAEWAYVPLKMEEKRPSRTTTMIVDKIES